jgi:hypothetical protein
MNLHFETGPLRKCILLFCTYTVQQLYNIDQVTIGRRQILLLKN